MAKPRRGGLGKRVGLGKGVGLLAFALVLASSVRCGEGLREDELECERAAIHVRECCPSVPERAFSCELVEGCESNSLPDLNADDARCLRTTSCADLADTCARLAVTVSSGGGGRAGSETTVSSPSINSRTICKGPK